MSHKAPPRSQQKLGPYRTDIHTHTDPQSISYALSISPTGTYTLELGQLDFGGTYTKVAETEPEDLYINYMWIESDINNYTLSYALLGNENAPDALNARIYVFDAFNG